MPNEAKKHGTFAGTLIGAVIVSLLSSGALSGAVNWGTAEKAGEAAAKAVDEDTTAKAKAEAAKVEKAIANYIAKEVEPKIAEAFNDVAEDLQDLDEDLRKCEIGLRETTILADTALRLAERSVGKRAVERELDRTERDEPEPVVVKDKKERLAPKFKDYQQQMASELD